MVDYEKVILEIYKNRYFVNHGPLAQAFEEALCHHFSSRHAVTVGNSSLALLIAIKGFFTGKVGVAPGCGPKILEAVRMAALDLAESFEKATSVVVMGDNAPVGVPQVVTFSPTLPKRGRHKAREGIVATFSLGPDPNLTPLQGGVIVTNDDNLAEIFRNIRSSYGTREKKDVMATCNGRYSEFQAGLGLMWLARM